MCTDPRTVIQQFVKSQDGRYSGLLVQRRFAERFLTPEKKTLELRHRPVMFLRANDCVALVACGRQLARQILAIMRYKQCFQIHLHDLESLQTRHCVTPEELVPFKKDAQRMCHDYVWGWEFEIVHVFEHAPTIKTSHSEVWMRFKLEDLSLSDQAGWNIF